MDVDAIIKIISNLGFPIFCCCMLFYQNNSLQKTLKELSETLTLMGDRLQDIEENTKKRGD